MTTSSNSVSSSTMQPSSKSLIKRSSEDSLDENIRGNESSDSLTLESHKRVPRQLPIFSGNQPEIHIQAVAPEFESKMEFGWADLPLSAVRTTEEESSHRLTSKW